MRVSVVIPAYNGEQFIGDQMLSLLRQTQRPFEIIVADNGSTDRTCVVALSYASRLPIRIVNADSRRGNAAARNIGAEHARGDIIVFLDQDDAPRETLLEHLTASVTRSSMAVGANHLAETWPPRREGEHLPVARLISPYGFLPFGLSCNMAIGTELFSYLQGFDESYLAATDVDLCWRAQIANRRCHFEDSAIVDKRRKVGADAAFRQHRSFGSDDPLLFKRFRQHGMRRQWRLLAKRLLWFVTRLPLLLESGIRRNLAVIGGNLLGRMRGSLRHRAFYL